MDICLARGADLHMAQLMPLLLTISCSSKVQIGFTFLVTAHLGNPGQRAIKWVCVCLALQRAEMRMVRWMCDINLKDRFPSRELRERLGTDDITQVLQ